MSGGRGLPQAGCLSKQPLSTQVLICSSAEWEPIFCVLAGESPGTPSLCVCSGVAGQEGRR